MLILASRSPRRIELLRQACLEFEVDPANIEESILPGESPYELVHRLATEKAVSVSNRHPSKVVLGADTIVYFQDRIIGKPLNLKSARALFLQLKGNTHYVYTGVCLTREKKKKTVTWFTVTAVTFRKFTDEELDYCLSTGNPLDKAGGYSFQDHEDVLVSCCIGLRSNVIGLPIEEVLVRLKEFSD